MTSATAGVPSSIDGVTPQWLTAALDGATVTDVHAEQIALGGFSSRLYRAHLSGDGVPKSVIVKLPAESEAFPTLDTPMTRDLLPARLKRLGRSTATRPAHRFPLPWRSMPSGSPNSPRRPFRH